MLAALLLLTLAWMPVLAEDVEDVENDAAVVEETSDEASTDVAGDGISSPKTMSGMSILGNEETPKSLVIVPWKSSEMGDAISLSDTLDDRATPVDKEVFLRELRYYQIRSSE
jgi:hypothetical protein